MVRRPVRWRFRSTPPAMASTPSFIVAIPARHGSMRLPGKPLRLIGGVPMIVHVTARALEAGAAEVVVATDDARIAEALQGRGARVAMTRADHASGSDRIAEVAEASHWSDETIVVNLQGDEPLAPASGIRAVAAALAGSDAPMATLATPIVSAAELFDPDCVKVVCDAAGRALYFSRAPLPWPRDAFARDRSALPAQAPLLRHIGIYAYRAGFLRRFAALAPTPLERCESLEQLRALEHGHAIAVCLAPEPFPAGVDSADDLARVERVLAGVT
jgi:3-deoxy-manno-octulosonate cytidylyltransferase (CMP-KDO synthetase)